MDGCLNFGAPLSVPLSLPSPPPLSLSNPRPSAPLPSSPPKIPSRPPLSPSLGLVVRLPCRALEWAAGRDDHVHKMHMIPQLSCPGRVRPCACRPWTGLAQPPVWEARAKKACPPPFGRLGSALLRSPRANRGRAHGPRHSWRQAFWHGLPVCAVRPALWRDGQVTEPAGSSVTPPGTERRAVDTILSPSPFPPCCSDPPPIAGPRPGLRPVLRTPEAPLHSPTDATLFSPCRR